MVCHSTKMNKTPKYRWALTVISSLNTSNHVAKCALNQHRTDFVETKLALAVMASSSRKDASLAFKKNLRPTGRQCPRRHGQTVCEPASRGGGVKYESSCDWRFQTPKILPKQEGFQLAEASFRENKNPSNSLSLASLA